MSRVFLAGLAATLAATLAGAMTLAMPAGGGPVGGHLNPGDQIWAATTGDPEDTVAPALSEHSIPRPTGGVGSQPSAAPPAPSPLLKDGDG